MQPKDTVEACELVEMILEIFTTGNISLKGPSNFTGTSCINKSHEARKTTKYKAQRWYFFIIELGPKYSTRVQLLLDFFYFVHKY